MKQTTQITRNQEAEMARQRKPKTIKQIARHYSKPSRMKRHASRYDRRVHEMETDLAWRKQLEDAHVAALLEHAERASLAALAALAAER